MCERIKTATPHLPAVQTFDGYDGPLSHITGLRKLPYDVQMIYVANYNILALLVVKLLNTANIYHLF